MKRQHEVRRHIPIVLRIRFEIPREALDWLEHRSGGRRIAGRVTEGLDVGDLRNHIESVVEADLQNMQAEYEYPYGRTV